MPVSKTSSFDAAVSEFMNAAIIGDSWEAALGRLAGQAEVTGAVLMCYNAHRLMTAIPSAGLASMYEDFFSGKSPPCSRLKRVKLGMAEGFRLDHDDYSDAELARDPFYQEFLRPQNAFWNAVVKLAPGPEAWGVELGFKRELKAGPYTSSERAALNSALPCLRTAARIAQRVQDARAEGVLQAVSARGDLLFELDAWGQVRREHGGSCGRENGFPTRIVRHRLAGTDHTTQAAIDRAVHMAIGEFARPASGVLETADGKRHLLHVVPVKGKAQDIFIGTAAIAILFADISAPRSGGRVTVLRNLLSLTQREAEITCLIGDGLSPAGVAQRLRIGVGTVRTHLKSTFEKSGTSRQSEPVALLYRLREVIG
jgi:DNA-binding CsgD family transcriptional regulator